MTREPEIRLDIKATTKLYGILGHPVSHSLSPSMHNNAFEKLGLDYVYLAFDITPGKLGEAVRGIKSLGIKGVNITIPHKQTIVNLVDEIDDDAMLVGAVNTVKNDDGKLVGYNTDVGGFLRAIKDDFGFIPTGKKSILIGAGGAARAVIVGLCNSKASEIVIINRTVSKAEDLAAEFGHHFPKIKFRALSLGNQNEIINEMRKCELLVNSSSAGMKGENPLNLPLGVLPRGACVYDLVYDPLVTPLVRDARDLRLNTQSGVSMLLYQGVDAFEIWTGRKAPVEEMKKALTVKKFLDDVE